MQCPCRKTFSGILLMTFKSEFNQAVASLDHLNIMNYNYVLQLDSCIAKMQFCPARVIRFASSALVITQVRIRENSLLVIQQQTMYLPFFSHRLMCLKVKYKITSTCKYMINSVVSYVKIDT